MKFVFYDDFYPGLVKADHVVGISDLLKGQAPQSLLEEFITGFSHLAPKLKGALEDRKGVPLRSVRLRPPVPKPKIMLNAVRNNKEGIGLSPTLEFFEKAPASIIGPGDTVKLPPDPATVFHHEAELALVIGKETKKAKSDEAMASVFGYTATIDVSARGPEVSQRVPGTSTIFPLWKHKSYDTFCPMGPVLVTKDEILNPHDLNVKLWVSGELRQNYNTAEMAHQIPEIIEFTSKENTLSPGDVINCGTNHQGLGAIQDGDILEIEVEGLGRMSLKVLDPLKRKWLKGIDKETAERVKRLRNIPK
ncbi:MAG: fumarylacetoacetate hydrolase family protein [Candidatus Bathyarchaeota archaeon]